MLKLQQLCQASDLATENNVTHTWDAAGNRSVRNGGTLSTYSYDAGNAISGYVSVSGHGTYSRDDNGNLIGTAAYNTSGTLTRLATLTYDGDNRVLVQNSVSATGAVQTFTYDGDGVRRSEVDGATTSNFIWDGNNLLQERNASQTLVAQYTNWPGVWGQLISQRRGSTTTWYNADNQMNVRTLTNSVRTVTDRYQYEAFGDELSAGGSTANAYRYGGNVGYYRDFAETYYVRQRMYWGALAQWITRDPIGYSGGDWNLYRYVGDNPIGAVDPNGLARDPRIGSNCTIRLVMNTFIPTTNVVLIPHVLYWGNGDARGYDSNGGSYRTMHTVVMNLRTQQCSHWEGLGTSVVNMPFGVKPWSRPGTNRKSLHTYCNRDKIRGGWNIHIQGNARTGFAVMGDSEYSPTPGITYRFQVHVDEDASVKLFGSVGNSVETADIYYPWIHE